MHFFFVIACYAITNPPITGTTPPAVPCPNDLCTGKHDGNYEYYYHGKHQSNYFLQCNGGDAYCQSCFPMYLEFSQTCNQCLYSKHDDCVTTKPWKPVVTYHCPDLCVERGHKHSGNIEDPYNPNHYIACWNGVTVGCLDCPGDLQFNEEENACLYERIYLTKPQFKHGEDEFV